MGRRHFSLHDVASGITSIITNSDIDLEMEKQGWLAIWHSHWYITEPVISNRGIFTMTNRTGGFYSSEPLWFTLP